MNGIGRDSPAEGLEGAGIARAGREGGLHDTGRYANTDRYASCRRRIESPAVDSRRCVGGADRCWSRLSPGLRSSFRPRRPGRRSLRQPPLVRHLAVARAPRGAAARGADARREVLADERRRPRGGRHRQPGHRHERRRPAPRRADDLLLRRPGRNARGQVDGDAGADRPGRELRLGARAKGGHHDRRRGAQEGQRRGARPDRGHHAHARWRAARSRATARTRG